MKLKYRPKKILLHLGYPKNGSTSIQQFLDKINNDNLSIFLPPDQFSAYIRKKNIYNQYKDINNEIFFEEKISPKKEKWIKFFDLNLKKYNVLSNEMFLYPTNYEKVDFIRTLKRYLEIFNTLNCKIEILICIRDPKKLHISYFTDMYHRLLQYDNELDNFEKYILSVKKNKIVNDIFNTFNFNKIVKQIQQLDQGFKINENLHILKLENLDNFKKYLFKFCEDLDLKKNYDYLRIQKEHITKKKSEIYIRNFDVISFFFKYDPKNRINYSIKKRLKSSVILNFLLGLYKIKNRYDNFTTDIVNDYYKEDLKELEFTTKLNLRKYYEL